MRAVNQAMGRVIRHRWDYGAVILADKRFGEGNAMGQMSAWLKPHVVQHANFGQAASSLTRFFKVWMQCGLWTWGSSVPHLQPHTFSPHLQPRLTIGEGPPWRIGSRIGRRGGG